MVATVSHLRFRKYLIFLGRALMWILQKMNSSSIRWSTIMREDLRVFFLGAQGSRYVFL